MTHSFDFTKSISFTCADPDSVLGFEPFNHKFYWHGKTMDKLGEYLVTDKGNQVFLELQFNFAREETYTVIASEGEGDKLANFAVQSHKTGKLYSFFRE